MGVARNIVGTFIVADRMSFNAAVLEIHQSVSAKQKSVTAIMTVETGRMKMGANLMVSQNLVVLMIYRIIYQ